MINLHTAKDDSLLGTLKYVSKTKEHQVYGALIPKEIFNEYILNSTAYKTYYAYANVSPKEPTKKPGKAKKDVTSTKKTTTKPKPTKNKAPVKADRGKDFHISHASGSSDGTDFESWVPDEQQGKVSGIDEGTGTKLGILDVPKYESKIDKESWYDSKEEDDDKDDTKDDDNNDGNDDDDSDEEEYVDEFTNKEHEENEEELDDAKEYEEDEEEYVDEFTNKEDDADNANRENKKELDDVEELYKDVNVNLRKEDVEMTDADQSRANQHNKTEGLMQSSSISSDFTEKLLNFENVSLVDNEIGSLMNTTVRHEELSSKTSTLYTIPVTIILEITFAFNITIPPPHPSFNPLLQQATPTPIASKVTNSFPALPDFVYVYLDSMIESPTWKDIFLEIKQVQYAQAIFLIPSIVDRYINIKQRKAIQQAIKSHTAECREEDLADRMEYIDLIDTSMRVIIKEEDKSLEAVVLAKFSSQPKSTYEAAASLSEFELTKILMDKMEEHKLYFRADYKRELYNALVKSYNTDKDLFDTYNEGFLLKRSRYDKDKDQDPSAGSDQVTKRRKSSKDVLRLS
nr:hypothetical protein [Tanacetum cinerariifolium]